MEKVVYLVGAGFSAPLGLPVMSNFLVKSKDMYFDNPDEYEYFTEVFDTIQRMSVIKNYYDADLFNIEEILSILEMESFLEEENDFSDKFKKYITDVIKYYTPEIERRKNQLPSNWYDCMFNKTSEKDFQKYGYFISSLLNLKMNRNNGNPPQYSSILNVDTKYSIISLNYDMVFENFVKYIQEEFESEDNTKFIKNINNLNDYSKHKRYLTKIHGCVSSGNIIPPTWNKKSDDNLILVWKLAKKMLENANHIRILGYSLPISDSYIKYLLKSSVLKSSHLKTIDVITLDPSGDVKKRYDNFIDFNYYRFKNADILDYFKFNLEMCKSKFDSGTGFAKSIKFDFLEKAHNEFMSD